MRRTLLVGIFLALLLPAQDKKTKTPELEVTQVSIHRINDTVIAVDGSVRNTSNKTYNKLQIVFEFFAPGMKSITIQRGSPEPDILEAGDLVEFHLQLRAPARAVHVTLGAEDGNGRELRVGKSGPYPVE